MLRPAPQHALDQKKIDHPFGGRVVVAHQIGRQLRVRARTQDIGEGHDRARPAHHRDVEVRQIRLVEIPEREALLGRVLGIEPRIRDRSQLGHERSRVRARHHLEYRPVLLRAPMRMAQVRAGRALEREIIERYPRLLAELAERQPEVDVERQIIGRDLIEHRFDRHAVAVLDERPDQGLIERGRSHGIAHGNPAAAGSLVHDECRACGVEHQILVAEQREIGRGIVGALDQHGGPLEVGRTRRRDGGLGGTQEPPQRIRRGDHGRHEQRPQAPRRRRIERELPPQIPAVGNVPVVEQHEPHRRPENQEDRNDPGQRVALFDERGAPAKAGARRHQSDGDASQDDRLLEIEPLEQRQQNTGAQEPHGQIPRGVEPAVQTMRQNQEADPDRAAQQMGKFQHGQRHEMTQPIQTVHQARRRARKQQRRAGPEHRQRARLRRDGAEPGTRELRDSHHGAAMRPELVSPQ